MFYKTNLTTLILWSSSIAWNYSAMRSFDLSFFINIGVERCCPTSGFVLFSKQIGLIGGRFSW